MYTITNTMKNRKHKKNHKHAVDIAAAALMGFVLGAIVVTLPNMEFAMPYQRTYGTSTAAFDSMTSDSSIMIFSPPATTSSITFSSATTSSVAFSPPSSDSSVAFSPPSSADPFAIADAAKQSDNETTTPTMLEMISAYLFGPSIPMPNAAEALSASLLPSQVLPAALLPSLLPSQVLPAALLPSQPRVGVTHEQNLPRTEQAPVPQQRIGETGEQRIEEVAVQRVDEPEERVGEIMHGAAPELDAVVEKEDVPNSEDQQRVETVGLTMAGKILKEAILGPLVLLFVMLFGGR